MRSDDAALTLIFASKFYASDSHEDALAYVAITKEGLAVELDAQKRANLAAIFMAALARIARVASGASRILAINRLLGFSNRVGMSNRPTHAPTPESNAQLVAFFTHFLKPPAVPGQAAPRR